MRTAAKPDEPVVVTGPGGEYSQPWKVQPRDDGILTCLLVTLYVGLIFALLCFIFR